MRILIKTRSKQIAIKEVPEAEITADGNIAFPKSGEKYLTRENTEVAFKNLLTDGYADLSEFESVRYHSEVLL